MTKRTTAKFLVELPRGIAEDDELVEAMRLNGWTMSDREIAEEKLRKTQKKLSGSHAPDYPITRFQEERRLKRILKGEIRPKRNEETDEKLQQIDAKLEEIKLNSAKSREEAERKLQRTLALLAKRGN